MCLVLVCSTKKGESVCLFQFCSTKKGETLRGSWRVWSCFASPKRVKLLEGISVFVSVLQTHLLWWCSRLRPTSSSISLLTTVAASWMVPTVPVVSPTPCITHPSPSNEVGWGRVGELFLNNPICTLLQTHWLAKSAQQHFSPYSDFVFNTETLYEQIPN